MEAKWVVYGKKADFKAIGEKYNIDQVVARVLTNRDVVGDDAIASYLQGSLKDTHSPSLMEDMSKGCQIMAESIRTEKSICIVSDYDVDGVMSNYILYDGLKRLGANVSYKIPDRIIDGYGINERIIEEAHNEGVNVIITCDNGIAAVDAIALAKSLGMRVVVTDHHAVPYDMDASGEKVEKLPPADAVIDIMRETCAYPFKGICGATVAYKFIRNLYETMGVLWEDETRYIEMVAIATVCDVMELRDENRIYVREGLKLLKNTKNLGLKTLLSVNELSGKNLSAFHLGFVIGPCINATGRLSKADNGLELLLEEDEDRAYTLANELLALNQERKSMTEEGVVEAIKQVEEKYKEDVVLVVYLPELHESIAGIVAGRLREHFYKPIYVITDTKEGTIKGSGRSIEGYHMFDALTEVKDLLLKYGGHELAAGFSLAKENLEEFRRRLNVNQHLTEEELTPVVRLDVPMPIAYISERLIEQLRLLEPFGKGNEKPIFGQSGLGIKRVIPMGKEKQYMKILFQDSDGYVVEAMDFNGKHFIECIKMWFSDEECDKILKGMPNNVKLDVAYYPTINEYGGRKTIQIQPILYRKTQ